MIKKLKNLYHFLSQIEDIKDLFILEKTPLQSFLYEHYKHNRAGHWGKEYRELRMRRIHKVLEICGTDFNGKRILDLGGGLGDTGAFFSELGAEVTIADGRQENLNIAKLRFPKLITKKIDAESNFVHLGYFDIILCFAFFEVIRNIENVADCMKKITNTIFLETTITDSSQCSNFHYAMTGDKNDDALYEIGSFPTSSYIENMFRDWNIKIHKEELTTENDSFDWIEKSDNAHKRNGKFLRRFWEIKKYVQKKELL